MSEPVGDGPGDDGRRATDDRRREQDHDRRRRSGRGEYSGRGRDWHFRGRGSTGMLRASTRPS